MSRYFQIKDRENELFKSVAVGKKNIRLEKVDLQGNPLGEVNFLEKVENIVEMPVNLAEEMFTKCETEKLIAVTPKSVPITPAVTPKPVPITPAVTPKPDGLDDLLGAAKQETKKAAAKKDERVVFENDETLNTLADQVIQVKKTKDEAERDWKTIYGKYKAAVKTARLKYVLDDPDSYSHTVEVPRGDNLVQASFHPYTGKVDESKIDGLPTTLFNTVRTLKVKESLTKNDEKLREVAKKLLDALGREEFLKTFDYISDLVPTRESDQTQFGLTPEQRTQLETSGVKQKVVVQVR